MKKKPFKLIYIDMDGVVANYVDGLLRLIKEDKTVTHDDIKDYDIHKFVSATQAQVDQQCDMWGGAFWENLPLYSNAKAIVAECRELSDHICFLTSPSGDVCSRHGKLRWLEEHFGPNPDVCFAQVGKHHYGANCDVLLIDDNAKTVEEFVLTGSSSVVCPRPWNNNGLNDSGLPLGSVTANQMKSLDKLFSLLSTNHPLPNAY